jgi:hypothetical protein
MQAHACCYRRKKAGKTIDVRRLCVAGMDVDKKL